MYKLVIVDDESAARNALCDYFPWDELGFEVVAQWEDGVKALEYLRANPVDVVFCDIVMPRLNGVELAEALYREGVRTKVIFLSGHASFAYAKQALAFGVKDYVVKPAKYRELAQVFTRIRRELDAEQTPPEADNAGEPPPTHAHNDKIIRAVQDYIAGNCRTASLEAAAQIVSMNPNYLSQFYKNQTGVYFSDYLQQVRMHRAAELLGDIRYKIYDISEMVGYANAKNFTRAFKKYYGVKPSEYRGRGSGHA